MNTDLSKKDPAITVDAGMNMGQLSLQDKPQAGLHLEECGKQMRRSCYSLYSVLVVPRLEHWASLCVYLWVCGEVCEGPVHGYQNNKC